MSDSDWIDDPNEIEQIRQRARADMRTHTDQWLVDYYNQVTASEGWVSGKARCLADLQDELASRGLPVPLHERNGTYFYPHRVTIVIKNGGLVEIPRPAGLPQIGGGLWDVSGCDDWTDDERKACLESVLQTLYGEDSEPVRHRLSGDCEERGR